MAKIVVSVDSFSIVSAHQMADIKKVAAIYPEALKLYHGEGKDKEEVFAVGTGATASLNKYGITFASESVTGAPKACYTEKIPSGTEDVKNFIVDTVGMSVVNLTAVEGQITSALTKIAEDRATVAASIEGLAE